MSIKETDLKIKQLKAEIEVEENNKKFYKATTAQKRVIICKDALIQIKLKKFIANSGRYLQSDELCSISNNVDSIELKSILPQVKSCQVCAKGALFLSEVMNRNNYKVGYDLVLIDNIKSDNIQERLEGLFAKNQLDLIEVAFEKRIIDPDNDYICKDQYDDTPTKIAEKAIKFGEKYSKANDRLIAILDNIIFNKGTFKP